MWERVRAKAKTIRVGIALVALVFFRSCDAAVYYRLTNTYQNYVWYLAAVILPIGFLCVTGPMVCYKLAFTTEITPAMRRYPQRKFAIMGALDVADNLLSSWPINGIGGAAANVLQQAALPMNMLMSLYIGTRYKWSHYVGATLVIYGVCVKLIPEFRGETGGDGGDSNGAAYFGWALMMISSTIPAAANNVYKEVQLKDTRMDPLWANFWICVWQLFFGIITMPTVGLPFQPDRVPLDQFGEYVKHANMCFFGKDAVPTDACSEYGIPVAILSVYMIFNFGNNQLMLYIFREGSSVLAVVASAARLPLVDILLMSEFISGGAAESFTIYDGFALFVLLVAVGVYNAAPELVKEGPRRAGPTDPFVPLQESDMAGLLAEEGIEVVTYRLQEDVFSTEPAAGPKVL